MNLLDDEVTAGGPPLWRKATYTILAAISFLYLTITTILFYVRRKKISDIRFRPLRLNLLNVVATIILCVMFCLRTAFYPNEFPCVLIHWPAHIGFFLYCSALTCRVLSLSWIAKYNLAKLRMSVVYSPFNFNNINFNNDNDNNDDNNNKNIPDITPMSPGLRERLDFPGTKLMNKLKKYRQFTTDKWLSCWILCPTMALAFIIALTAQLTSPNLSIKPLSTNCVRLGVQFIPIYVLIGIFLLVICPVLIYFLYGVRDAFGLKNELMVTLFSGAVAYAGHFIFELVLPNWKNYFGSLMFGWVTFMLCHTLSITIPLIRSYKVKTYPVPNPPPILSTARGIIKRTLSVKSVKRNNVNNNNNHNNNNNGGDGKSKRYIMFEKVLEDPELFELYKICAASCFCTELIIFLQEYQYLKTLVTHYCTPTSKEILPPPSPKLHIAETGHISFPENPDILHNSPPLLSPSLITTPCTKSIVETVSAASWIPFPYELRRDFTDFYETFFDSNSDLAINFPGSLLNDVKYMVENKKYELTMYEQARYEVLNLLYRNTFERFLKMCSTEIAKKGL